MKKLGLLTVMLFMLFGCNHEVVKDVDGVFVCGYHTKTIMNDSIEFDSYIEQLITVTDGYIDTVENRYYITYDDIETYYKQTVDSYYDDLYYSYENMVSDPGFSVLAPMDTGEAIVTIDTVDYRNLSIFQKGYLPEKALNIKGNRIVYQKYYDNYLGKYSCELKK